MRLDEAKRSSVYAPTGALTWALTLALTCAVLPASAQTVRTLQDSALRAERSIDAAVLAPLPSATPVNLLQLSGGWAQVQTSVNASVVSGSGSGNSSGNNLRGWLRASVLELRPPELSAASQIETGRRASGNTAVTLGSRGLTPRSNRHALIIGIGRYQADPARPVPHLDGLDQDMASALLMARTLQVPDANITLLRDQAATAEGIATAIRELGERALPGDRVFVYWSGHGSRYFDAAEGGCVESLLPYDLKDVTNRELARWLAPVGAKADKMFVVYDACHSGGVGGASASAAAAGPARRSIAAALQAKFVPGSDACQVPSNVRSRSLASATAALGLTGQDVVNFASSRSDEISLQNPLGGGLATSALRECLLGDAVDADGSGSVSAQELADCAQAKIDKALAGNRDFGTPHITLAGNRDFVPAWFANAVGPISSQIPSQIASPVASSVTAAPSMPIPEVAAPAPVPLSRVLQQIHDQRDGKRTVTVAVVRDRLRIGADAMSFSVTSSHAGQVYAAMLGSDGRTLYLLFPNRLDADNRIAAGQTLTLPRPNWTLTAGGPPGTDTLLVLVADGPRDLPALRGTPAGPFVQPLTDAQGRAQLQWLLGTNMRQASGAACVGSGCSDAFGSALVSVLEY